MSETGMPSQPQPDNDLDVVLGELSNIPDLHRRVTSVIRKSVDNVLQGDRTGRYSITQLTPEEKKHIGTQVERGLKSEFFQDRKGQVSDTTVAGVEVDIKNTIGDNWMIPPEAVGRLCLLTQINERSAKFSVGLIRAREEQLGKENQDKKRSLSKQGKASVSWLIKDAPLPISAFLKSDSIRDRVFEKGSGQARVTELFRQVRKVPIQRSDIEAAAATKDRQVDLRARVRDAKTRLLHEGVLVLRGWNPAEKKRARMRGYEIDEKHCISIPDEDRANAPT
jgi:Restriction endonuclease NaeI